MNLMGESHIFKTAVVFSTVLHFFLLFGPGRNLFPEGEEPEDAPCRIKIERITLLPEIDIVDERTAIEDLEVKEEELAAEEEQEKNPEEKEPLAVEEDGEIPAREKKKEHVKEQVEVLEAEEERMLHYKDTIKQKIQAHRRYPSWAREQKFEGVARVGFILRSDGTVIHKRIIASSGFGILDREAIATVKRAAPFEPIPLELSRSSISIELELAFLLNHLEVKE